MVISTPNLKELPTVLTMDGATQRYNELRAVVEQYLSVEGSSDVESEVKHALYELQDFHKTQLHRVDDLVGRLHQEQNQHIWPVESSQSDTDEFGGEACWYYNDDGEMEWEHTSEGC